MKKKKLNGFQTKQRNQQKKINKKKLNDYTKQRNLKTTMLGINTPVKTRLIDEDNVEFTIGEPSEGMRMETTFPLMELPETIVYTFSDEYLNKVRMVRYDEDIKNITWGILNPNPFGEYFETVHKLMKNTFNSFIKSEIVVEEFLIKYGVMCREIGYMGHQLELFGFQHMTFKDRKRKVKNIPIIDYKTFIGKNEVELTLEKLDRKYGTDYSSVSSSKFDEMYEQRNSYQTNEMGVS